MASPRFCEQCGSALSPTARFCANCGLSLSVDAPGTVGGAAPQRAPSNAMLPWLLPVVAIVVVVGYALVTRSSEQGVPNAAAVAADGMGGTAPDISALSPDERVDRLFNRVMAMASAGKTDSVAFFAPMAVNSFAALEPLSLHRRYDLGLILLVSGEVVTARAQSDTILAEAPKHLLGLALAMRAARAAGNATAAERLGDRFKAALASERAKALPEYQDHASDINDALAEAEGRAPNSSFAPK